jgi:hypothetical protein
MPITYDNIATTTLSSAASTITFSSIPSTYTDLRLVVVNTSSSANNQGVRFNSDTGTNYSSTIIWGDGSTAQSFRYTSAAYIHYAADIVVAPETNPAFSTIDIFSYAGATNKTCLITTSLDLNGSGEVVRRVGLWRSTSVIDTITLMRTAGNYSAGSIATLYGIKNA